MKRAAKGLTIVELMVAIAILAVLLTIVSVASSGAIRAAREKRRNAMAMVLREGISTYFARNGKWPGAIESCAQQGEDRTFSGTEADAVFQEIVKGSRGTSGSPYLDPHALFVAPQSSAGTANGYGVSFDEAVMKNPPPHRRSIGVSEMAFGYQDPSTGRFVRYKIKYIAASDFVQVVY